MKVSDVVDAIEENGAPQYFGWFESPSMNAFCALGMAAHNLSMQATDLNDRLLFPVPNKTQLITEAHITPPEEIFLTEIIVYLNDEKKLSFVEIANYIRTNFPEILDQIIPDE